MNNAVPERLKHLFPALDALKNTGVTVADEVICFEDFPKMARLSREIIITEKIDGTNAQVAIGHTGLLKVGSRTQWITPQDDNHGFASWAYQNRDELLELGPGRHFGEWWGLGINKRYRGSATGKKFSLFNTTRWGTSRPACCDVVPVLYRGMFSEEAIMAALELLKKHGSVASPGCMDPEGIVIYHTAAGMGFKKTIKKDEVPKSVAEKNNGSSN